MNFPTAVILTGWVTIAQLTAAVSEAPASPAVMPAKSLAEWVADLGNESFRVREVASQELWKKGESAASALQEAANSADPEVSFRARELLRKIQLHVTPDTDPIVITWVESYQKASVSEKSVLLGKMRDKRAWRQMLKLYAGETKADAREKLRESVDGVAQIAAREYMAKGDDASAREFLEMAPVDHASLLALAEFHRSHGTLAAELEKLKTAKGPKVAAWRMALYRASGDLKSAREAAQEAKEPRIAALMAAIMGDPLPWLQDGLDDQKDIYSTYASLAVKHWLGKKVSDDDRAPLTKTLAMRRNDDRQAALKALFLLGDLNIAEPAFAKAEPLDAFLYFQTLERIPESLITMELDPANPDYKGWVEKRVAKLTDKDIEDQHGASNESTELIAMANFLERKGLHEQAYDAFSGALMALEKKDKDAFQELLANLFDLRRQHRMVTAAPQLAMRIGKDWAAQNEGNWEELVSIAMGSDELAADWWKWLAALSPKESAEARFAGLMALFDIGPDPMGLKSQWLAKAWQATDTAVKGEKNIFAARISSLSLTNGDVTNSLKAWEFLSDKDREDISVDLHFIHLTAAERWGEAADLILKQIKHLKDAQIEPRAELHAYAAAALRKAGRAAEATAHDQWADKLALGDAEASRMAGNCYANGGDFRRASEWWARAVREVDPDAEEMNLLFALKTFSQGLLREGRWKECAAITEVIAKVDADSDMPLSAVPDFTRIRLQADMARALANLPDKRAESIDLLEHCHQLCISDGSLADYFFPAVRGAGLVEQHNAWFEKSWQFMLESIRLYPDSDSTRNTAAWFAARALRRLDEAEKLMDRALELNPGQPAYIDTMAELQFARGHREKALEWSHRAVLTEPEDIELRRQLERFSTEPLPK